MRLVFVAFHGGVHTRRWAAFFAERGHEVHVVTCGGASAAPYAVHDLGPLRFGKLAYLLKLPRARRLIRDLQPDVLHAHYATSYGLLGLATGVHPFVVTAHGDDVLIAPRNPLLRVVVSRVLAAADLVTVPSEQMREAVVALIGGATPVDVFQYGVESRRLARLGDEQRTAGEAHVIRIVSARPLLRLYRVDALLRAFAELRTVRSFACDIVGDGPERPALEHLADSLGLGDKVAFHGHVSPDEAERALARADVYVSVSESDGASVALLEAMALGAVPVLSDIPANRAWVVDGRTGVLVDIEPRSIAEGIERAASLDRASVSEANRRLIRERADRDRNLGQLEARLRALVPRLGAS
jgi:glycosyltransferase involved in cell wall biosynthesis